MKRTLLATVILAALGGAAGAGWASTGAYLGQGEKISGSETGVEGEQAIIQSTDYKLVGGWDYSAEDAGDHSQSSTEVILTGGTFDEVIGGNHRRNSAGDYSLSIGDTSVAISGGTVEYAVGGSKISTSAGGVTNGDVQMSVSGEANITKDLIGGNYLKSTTSGGGGKEVDNAGTVGDVELTISGGSFGGRVIGGSYANNYAATSGTDYVISTKTGSVKTLISGGVFSGDIIGSSVAEGEDTQTVTSSSSLTIQLAADSSFSITSGKRIVGGSYIKGTNASGTTTGSTSITIDGTGEISLATNIIGGDLIESSESAVSTIEGDSSVTIDAANLALTQDEEIIGGSYLRFSPGTEESPAAATVKNTAVVIRAGTFNGNIIAGGKTAATAGSAVNTVTGNTALTITGGTFNGMLIGGGSAKGHSSNTNIAANVDGTASISVLGAETPADLTVAGIIGGGLAYQYGNGTPTIEAATGSTAITVENATIKTLHHDSGIDGFNLGEVAIIAGGAAFNSYHSDESSIGKLSSNTTSTSLSLNNVVVNNSIYAGGYAYGTGTTANVESASLTLIDTTVSGDVSTGGYALEGGTASVDTAEVTLSNTTITGALILASPSAALLDAASTMSSGAHKVTSANFTGANTIGSLSGTADVYTLTATEANADGTPILNLTDENAVFNISGAEVYVNNAFNGLVVTNADIEVDADTTMTVSSTFLTTTYAFDEAATLADGLTVTNNGLLVGDENLISGTTTTNDNTKTLSMAFLGSAAFVNQGAEFIADEGLDAMTAAARQGGFTGFAAVHGGRSTYETGSHVSLWGATLAAGAAGRIGSATVAGFVEAGWASSDSSDSGASGDADHDYYGVGAAVRYAFDNPFYLDGAVRLGVASTDFSGRYAGANADYDSDSFYTTAHVGGGWLADIGGGLKLDVYGRYIFSYIEGDDATLSNHSGTFEMDDVTAHTIRAGAALLGNLTPAWSWRAGLAYEHVFNGDAESAISYGGLRGTLDTPTLEGNTGILDLEAAYEEEGSPWRFGLGLKGYAGDRQGVSGSADVLYRF